MGRIGIEFPREQITDFGIGPETKLKDIPFVMGIERLNYQHAHMFGARYDWDRDRLVIGFVHNEFPAELEGSAVWIYTLKQARAEFPFLFVDTNPLLWRKFK